MVLIRAGDITGFDDAEIIEQIAPVQPGAENREDREEKEGE